MSAADHTAPTGLAIPRPAMSGAEPCTGSNIDGCSPVGSRLPDGAMPIEPATAAARSLRMSPNRLEATMTSKRAGSRTSLAHSASMCSWSQATPGAAAARSRTSSSQNGMVWTIPLDFVAEVRCPPRRAASANA